MAACGGGGTSSGDKTKTAEAESTSAGESALSATQTASAAVTRVTTPSPSTTPAATTPPPGGASPGAGSTPGGGAPGGGAPGGSSFDKTATGGDLPPEIGGGSTDATPQFVETPPPPPPGVTPQVDSTVIAPPDPPSNDLQLLIDLDASTPGIQSTRDVKVGDVFRASVVIVNAPQFENDAGGIGAFNFNLNYDKTKIIAPSIAGGPSTNRNPMLNMAALGGDAAGWSCLPAPEGDLDDPGGIPGDGVPGTGQAFLSCFTPGTGHEGGTIVLATIEFHAVATGSSNLALSEVELSGGSLFIAFAHCNGDSVGPFVPCAPATVNVR
jgi:hypothetical protein